MSNEIFKTGDVVEVMPSHAQTWKNGGKIAIGHRFIIEDAEKWNDGYEHCEGAVQKFDQNYHSKDLKIVERDGKLYIDERWEEQKKEEITNSFPKFNIGDDVQMCEGGWYYCNPETKEYMVRGVSSCASYDSGTPKKIIEITQSEDGMYWYMLNDYGNYISEGGLKFAEKKEEPKNKPVPVEKKKFNVGDWVKCVETGNTIPLDAGWQENLVFEIINTNAANIAYGGKNGNGVYFYNLIHASPLEIPVYGKLHPDAIFVSPVNIPYTFEKSPSKELGLYTNSKPSSIISIKSIDSVQTKLIKKKSRVLF